MSKQDHIHERERAGEEEEAGGNLDNQTVAPASAPSSAPVSPASGDASPEDDNTNS